MIYRLDERLIFPNPYGGEPDGLIAVGGDLSTERLLLAYGHGIFPWFSFRDSDIMWFCPLQRFVIFPSEIHVSHSMRTLMRKNKYESENKKIPFVYCLESFPIIIAEVMTFETLFAYYSSGWTYHFITYF